MDFDRAAARLAADHSTLRSKRRSKQTGLAVSARARREAEANRRRAAERIAEQRRARARLGFGVRYMDRCDARLGVVRDLGGGGGGGGSSDGAASGANAAAAVSTGTSGGAGPGGPLPAWNPAPSLLLRPTSIHGDGDKLSLPPSVLARLAESGIVGGGDGGRQQPLAFRVGVLNPEYGFPSSRSLRELVEGANVDEGGEVAEDDDGGDSDYYSEDEKHDNNNDDEHPMDGTETDGKEERRKRRANSGNTGPYLDELSRRYVAYTHATVVEFTQDEGRVGLPQSVASALLGDASLRVDGGANGDGSGSGDGEGEDMDKISRVVPRTRTVDPASAGPIGDGQVGATEDGTTSSDVMTNADESTEKADPSQPEASSSATTDDGEKTPGHLAWGAFDVPDTPVEITLIKLPKGKGCTLIPTPAAVRLGFYNLKDVKLVLEQSLIRTRATLSLNDVVHAWHRGKKFDLVVRDVTPGDFGAVSCINTDIEVDLAPPETEAANGKDKEKAAGESAAPLNDAGASASSFAPGAGRRLSDGPAQTTSTTTTLSSATPTMAKATANLPPEPPADQTTNVCTVQVRGDGATGRRRFDINRSQIRDLFVFASSACNMEDIEGKTFRLVTRFPRRVFSIGGGNGNGGGGMTLADAGIGQGQEMFMVERLN